VAVSLRKVTVTVEVKDPLPSRGKQAKFYARVGSLARAFAVKELGHEIVLTAGRRCSRHWREDLRTATTGNQSTRICSAGLPAADYVVVGRITDVHNGSSQSRCRALSHLGTQRDWHEAVLQIQSILKGPKIKRSK